MQFDNSSFFQELCTCARSTYVCDNPHFYKSLFAKFLKLSGELPLSDKYSLLTELWVYHLCGLYSGLPEAGTT